MFQTKTVTMVVLPWLCILAAGGCSTTRKISEMRQITVYGEGRAVAAPDSFRVVVGVGEWNKDLDQATTRVREASRRVIAASQAFPIDEGKTQTLEFTVAPEYSHNYETGVDDFHGYSVKQTFVFTITDVTRAEDLIVSLLKAGATEISDVAFRSAQEKTLVAKATESALKDARKQAEAMAAVLGQRVGLPLQIEGDSHWTYRASPYAQYADSAYAGWINPKDVAVTIDVTVIFSLE